VADLREAMNTDDVEAIKAKTQALSQASMKLGEAIYRASQAEGGAEGGPGADAGASGGSEEKVVDAEFEEVDPERDKKAG
jgi:molecular chaperone DnaK